MKLILVIALCHTAFFLPKLRADDTIFPEIGATYFLSYPTERGKGVMLINRAKIISRGDSQWYLIEYTRDKKPTDQGVQDKASRLWLNFAYVLAATKSED